MDHSNASQGNKKRVFVNAAPSIDENPNLTQMEKIVLKLSLETKQRVESHTKKQQEQNTIQKERIQKQQLAAQNTFKLQKRPPGPKQSQVKQIEEEAEQPESSSLIEDMTSPGGKSVQTETQFPGKSVKKI